MGAQPQAASPYIVLVAGCERGWFLHGRSKADIGIDPAIFYEVARSIGIREQLRAATKRPYFHDP